MITAEECLINQEFYDNNELAEWQVQRAMVEFAKLHVDAALKVASKSAKIIIENPGKEDDRYYRIVSEDSILNAYPLTLIQ